MPDSTAPLATFDSRFAMRYERFYPHPIERVWEAVTTSEHLDVWLLPISKVEPWLGGKCSFSWGSPASSALQSTVTEFEPPHRVTYADADGASIRFVLERVGEGTRLFFIQTFQRGAFLGATADEWGDQPAGPDAPWRPGFVGGFHFMLDQLGEFLAGRWTREQASFIIEAVYGGRPFPGQTTPAEAVILSAYREHIREHCPPE